MNDMPVAVAFDSNHIFMKFSAEITRNVAANITPNLTVTGMAAISPNEVRGAVYFGPPGIWPKAYVRRAYNTFASVYFVA